MVRMLFHSCVEDATHLANLRALNSTEFVELAEHQNGGGVGRRRLLKTPPAPPPDARGLDIKPGVLCPLAPPPHHGTVRCVSV